MIGPEKNFEDPNEFERQLARAMRRVEAPANFTEAVLRRASANVRPPARVLTMSSGWRAAQAWAAGAVAATLLIGFGAQQFHHHRESAEATRQFEVATQIEQQALNKTREKLSRSGITLEAQ